MAQRKSGSLQHLHAGLAETATGSGMTDEAAQAFDAGYQAFIDGVHLDDNPYFQESYTVRLFNEWGPDTMEAHEWQEGWNTRAREKAE